MARIQATCGHDSTLCSERQRQLESLFPTRVDVTVTRTGEPMTLVLTAYEATKWRLKIAPGVIIKKIILNGNHEQSLRRNDALKDVLVESGSYHSGDPHSFYFYGDDRDAPIGYVEPRDILGEPSPCIEDSSAGWGYESSFANTLRQLKRRRLVPTSIQAQPPSMRLREFHISNESAPTAVEKIRFVGRCYRNPDGTITEGHL